MICDSSDSFDPADEVIREDRKTLLVNAPVTLWVFYCRSDTEAMMDAFDVFDSFNDQNSSPIASDVEKPREDPQTGNEVSTLSVEPTFPRNSEDVPITEEVNFSGERYFEMPL